ncbi:formyl transferase [Algibacter miyuki]
MLTSNGPSSYNMYNGLKNDFDISHVIVEGSGSIKTFLKKRVKRLGYIRVFGQILFSKLLLPFLKWESKQRVHEITETHQLQFEDFDLDKKINVPSVNSEECIKYLQQINPDIVIVNGTRIISKKVLNSISGIFINTHMGITPLYRGVHGGYWSKVNKDEHCGVSVHLVDQGIDTGGILRQGLIETTTKDNFITYTYLQMAKGCELMKLVITDILNDGPKTIKNNLESKIWTHPTIWFYLKHRIFNGVK